MRASWPAAPTSGLWVTKQHRALGDMLYIGNVAELAEAAVREGRIDIGAAVPLADAHRVLAEHHPELDELMRRFASPPIRNAGTLCGNVANGSPIGDSMPNLIALGTTVVLRKGTATRELPLEDLYLAYQKTAMQSGEFVERIRVPLARPGLRLPQLQDFQALRSGHLGGVRGVRADARRREDRAGARGVRRHGGDAEARGAV